MIANSMIILQNVLNVICNLMTIGLNISIGFLLLLNGSSGLTLRLPFNLIHERSDQARMWFSIHPFKKIIFILSPEIWLGTLGPEQTLPAHGKAA